MNKALMRLAVIVVGVALASATLTACSTTVASPLGMCGWVVGDGQDGQDRAIHETIYENQNPNFSTETEDVHYVPCGPRNYRVTNGDEIGLDGVAIGDLKKPFEATTLDLTPVKVEVDAFWQLNQSEDALRDFKELCNKYTCYTTDTSSGDSNFATTGWNGMLQENFAPSMEEALKIGMSEIPDAIWAENDLELYTELESAMSTAFMETVRATTGYSTDLFCGSGNSGWTDTTNPGADGNTFTCTSVRFEVRSVTTVSAAAQESAAAQSQEDLAQKANESRYNAAYSLYGEQTSFWLGVQDALSLCPTGSYCNFYLGEILGGSTAPTADVGPPPSEEPTEETATP